MVTGKDALGFSWTRLRGAVLGSEKKRGIRERKTTGGDTRDVCYAPTPDGEGPQGTHPPSNNVHNSRSQRAEDDQGSQNQDDGAQDRRTRERPENEEDPLVLMKAQIKSLAKQVRGKAPTTVEELVQNTDSPFTPEVMREPLPRKFKMPHVDAFGGITDTLDHLETYKNLMMLQAVPNEIMCSVFPVTLKGSARMWFNKLKP
ncbi:hypothetical protein Vadar_022197 [Vaccinium darrowii]|uniref:Uncharacterized protein n=1 Tax=Vaccinium darrowii TaxID=229202 RepID=A0ACB7ZFK0_9ERIC|nr:hypothetical protein Vadar_022197 [Vaccinium darrowii]